MPVTFSTDLYRDLYSAEPEGEGYWKFRLEAAKLPLEIAAPGGLTLGRAKKWAKREFRSLGYDEGVVQIVA